VEKSVRGNIERAAVGSAILDLGGSAMGIGKPIRGRGERTGFGFRCRRNGLRHGSRLGVKRNVRGEACKTKACLWTGEKDK